GLRGYPASARPLSRARAFAGGLLHWSVCPTPTLFALYPRWVTVSLLTLVSPLSSLLTTSLLRQCRGEHPCSLQGALPSGSRHVARQKEDYGLVYRTPAPGDSA